MSINELRRRLNSLVKLKYKIVEPESLYAIIIPDIIEKLRDMCELYRKRVGKWGVTIVFDCINAVCVHVVIKTTPVNVYVDRIVDMYYIIEEARCKESLYLRG